MGSSIAALRQEYMRQGLSEHSVAADPFKQFRIWFDELLALGLREPNTMVLATATRDGRPSARAVLLKAFDERGFVFFTNYESRKGRELDDNPWAALTFVWVDLERQVRIEGSVERVSEEESSHYFESRPTGSQLGAWASQQSTVISGREVIERRVARFAKQFEGGPVPRPPYWGGYRVKPTSVEFWQGRPNRLHDRLRYWLADDGRWLIERLAP